MILQNVVFPKEEICEENGLYYRKIQGMIRKEEKSYVLAPETELTFFTYFNGFSADKWKLYTQVKHVDAVVECEGEGEMSLWRVTKTQEGLQKECLCREEMQNGERRIPFLLEEQSGILYIAVKAKTEMKLCCAYFECTDEVVNDVTLAIGICTFRREEFVTRTLDTLREYLIENSDSPLYKHLHVYVSDNGNTLPAKELSNDYIHVVANKNAGGAGGFGRCMLEASKAKENYNLTHILLMDDDIVLEPESIVRTYTLLSMVKPSYADAMLGGGLLRMDIPNIQHANGELWHGGVIGFTKRGFDLCKEEDVFRNEEDLPMEYNGWWFCCLPLANHFRGFPLPIFIHGDDIEYGLRFNGNIMTMNGIGVWHDAFDNRKASSMEYYDMRNTLIACAIHHPEFSCLSMVKRVCRHLIGQMLHLRIEDQLLTMKGVEDFCQGVRFLQETDPTELHPVIMGMGYAMQDVSEDLKKMGVDVEAEKPQPEHLYEDAGFAKRHLLSINGWLLPGRRETLALPMGRHPDALYRCKKALLYDPDTKKGFYVTRRTRDLFLTFGRCLKMWRLLAQKYKKTVRDFQENSKELVSQKFWEEYVGTVHVEKMTIHK